MKKTHTDEQKAVLYELRHTHDCPWIASAAEREWKRGEPYYIDSRVYAPRIRRRFNKCNKVAEKRD